MRRCDGLGSSQPTVFDCIRKTNPEENWLKVGTALTGGAHSLVNAKYFFFFTKASFRVFILIYQLIYIYICLREKIQFGSSFIILKVFRFHNIV